MLLVIDNYDSFAHNLARYLRRLQWDVQTVRNDQCTPDDVARWQPRAIILSPGPCTPKEAGCSLALVQEFSGKIPILGVCLGHQTIGCALGAQLVRARHPSHGHSAPLRHDGRGVFADVPDPFQVGRYHSLVLEPNSIPSALEITGWLADDTVMAVQHRRHPTVGWQFHPESVLTEHGYRLLMNFGRLAGLAVPDAPPQWIAELRPKPQPQPLPDQPVTF